MKIATLVDKKGNSLPFGESGVVKLYDSDVNGWKCLREIRFEPDANMNLSGIRQCIYGLVSQLDDCKSFVMKRAPGIFNAIFEEELGISVWRVNGSSFDSLSQIKAQAEKAQAAQSAPRCKCSSTCGSKDSETFWPTPVGALGNELFQINLVEVQQKNCSLNSQEILLPFLESKIEFIELEIICTHVPKWLNRVLGKLHLELVTEERKDGFCHAFIYREP
ncbi:MAG: Fe-only nitrogenase accessory protein AnfO [Tannerella sp.]|jgi:Fe-only nitrogenase accessory protein AnfO|nr:Fe-only nitrogenase accessory protein AnfO [Tannerella sp.]